MKMTNAQMFDSLQVLTQVEEQGVLGYAIARNRRKLADELQEYLAKRDELLQEYGTDDGEGRFTFTQEAAQAFSAADFCSGSLTSSQMFALEWMVKEDEA